VRALYTQPNGDRVNAVELEPIAVVDIGSNSVRLVVYEGAVRAPTPIFNEKVLAGLGRTIATTGNLDAAGVARTLEALARFRAITRVLGVKNIRAIATAACREAKNGKTFIAESEKALGVHIDVLSGEQEAEMAAAGIIMGFGNTDGIIGDMGGGSLELIDLKGTQRQNAITLPLGGLRLIDSCDGKIDKAFELTERELDRASWLANGQGRTFYVVGGAWRSLAKLHMEATKYPLRVMQGYTLKASDAIDFCERVRKSKKGQGLEGIEAVSKARRETLTYGALVLERALKRMKAERVVFSVFGIREGLLFKLLGPHEQVKDPLIAFATDYAQLRSRSIAHAHELCAWTDALYTQGGPKETDDERRLRHAACLLSDIGWRAHPDYRGEQSLNVVAHSGMAGIDHPGRIFLAQAVYYRHNGIDGDDDVGREFSERLNKLMPERLQLRAKIVGAAVRAAHMLSIGRPGIIDEVQLSYDRDRLVVVIPKAHTALDGERFRRRIETLARLLGKTSDVRVGR
jgi:exopolyphosphatase / guanosine-5'-triphosphate,3'-diphosphate pyrophosphatase